MKKTFQVAAVTLSLVSQAHAQDAVQWRVEDGGNGHWYWFDSTSRDWAAARSMAEARGGHLATIASPSENQFVLQTLTSHAFYADYWLGGYRIDESCTPPCVRWITGEPWSFEVWDGGDSWGCWDPNPNACGWNGPGTGLALEFNNRPDTVGYGKWNDESPNLYFNGNIIGNPSILEWSADCNNDGIVDKGQILQGRLVDSDHNGVPDVCEIGPCPGDITNGGTVDAIDLSILLSAWGTSGQGEFDADADNNGIVDGGDLALVLGGWGPCPQ